MGVNQCDMYVNEHSHSRVLAGDMIGRAALRNLLAGDLAAVVLSIGRIGLGAVVVRIDFGIGVVGLAADIGRAGAGRRRSTAAAAVVETTGLALCELLCDRKRAVWCPK